MGQTTGAGRVLLKINRSTKPPSFPGGRRGKGRAAWLPAVDHQKHPLGKDNLKKKKTHYTSATYKL